MNLQRRLKPSIEISTAPIADIVFLLLIYFMLTSSFVINRSLEVDLPQSTSNKPHSGANTVTITSDLQFAWNQDVVQKEQLPGFIKTILTDDDPDNNTVTLKVDKTVMMEEVAYVMSSVAQYGGKVVILTRKTNVEN